MNNQIQFAFGLITSITLLCISSCTKDPVSSFNRFIIDNQSSTELFYNTGTGLDARTIEIAILDQTEIEVAEFDGDGIMLIQAEEFFSQNEEDIYLLKEMNGNFIQALQLNTTGILIWRTDKVGNDTYEHILQITDEMLD